MRIPVLLAASLLGVPALAATGGAITHQGYLLDSADKPVEAASVQLGFKIIDQSLPVTSQQVLWEATCTTVVRHGFFGVTLGSGCGSPITGTAADFSQERWLQISSDGVEFTPRLRLLPAASAALATNALALAGHPVADFVLKADAADAKTLEGVSASGFWKKTDAVEAATVGGVGSAGLWKKADSVDAATLQGAGASAFWKKSEEVDAATLGGNAAGAYWKRSDAVDAATLGGGAPGTFWKKADAVDAATLGGKTISQVLASVDAIDAAKITSGTLPDARLSGTYSQPVNLSNAGNTFSGGLNGKVTIPKASAHPFTCDANAVAAVYFNTTDRKGYLCNGKSWRVFADAAPDGSATDPGTSCKTLRQSGFSTDGTYVIDPDGGDIANAFSVWCNMTIDGGGWTLITSISSNSAVTAVTNSTLITPSTSTNVTNRNMGLPGVTEILIVNDGKDSGADTAFDRAEKYTGVSGINLSWQQMLDALNQNTGGTWLDNAYSTGSDDSWQFSVSRVNTTGCLQTALRGAYGDGNYGSFNTNGPGGVGGLGMLWHHWGAETWISGGYLSVGLTCNGTNRDFTSFWKGLYLR